MTDTCHIFLVNNAGFFPAFHRAGQPEWPSTKTQRELKRSFLDSGEMTCRGP
jgi:hypothetical protein